MPYLIWSKWLRNIKSNGLIIISYEDKWGKNNLYDTRASDIILGAWDGKKVHRVVTDEFQSWFRKTQPWSSYVSDGIENNDSDICHIILSLPINYVE